jgi:hypothetical protein
VARWVNELYAVDIAKIFSAKKIEHGRAYRVDPILKTNNTAINFSMFGKTSATVPVFDVSGGNELDASAREWLWIRS